MRILAASLLLAAASALAQQAPTSFPDGSSALTTAELTTAIAGKVFAVQPFTGPPWRLQYSAGGYFYVNAGDFRDSGTWSTKDGTICAEGKQIKYFCNEVQAKDNVLYLKRESGEVVKLGLR